MEIYKIIIEGPDCSGKSTLVNRLKNKLKWDSKSLHHIEGDQFERYAKEYLFNSKSIFDRSHFSETVYSQLWRGGTPFSNEEMNFLNFLSSRNSLIVFVCPELNLMKERYIEREYEQQISLDELEKSLMLFKETIQSVNHLTYKSSSYNELDQLVEKVQKLVNTD